MKPKEIFRLIVRLVGLIFLYQSLAAVPMAVAAFCPRFPHFIWTNFLPARMIMADFFNASPREVAFGNNMTTITFHIARALGRGWGPGDEIVVTELDHQANVAPWRALAKERGVIIRSVPFDIKTGELAWD